MWSFCDAPDNSQSLTDVVKLFIGDTLIWNGSVSVQKNIYEVKGLLFLMRRVRIDTRDVFVLHNKNLQTQILVEEMGRNRVIQISYACHFSNTDDKHSLKKIRPIISYILRKFLEVYM